MNKKQKWKNSYYDNYENKRMESMKGNLIVGLVVAGIGGIIYVIDSYYAVVKDYILKLF